MKYLTILLLCFAWGCSQGITEPPILTPTSATINTEGPWWSVWMSVQSPTAQDNLITFGASVDAGEGYDYRFDMPKPPPPPYDYIQGYFSHPEWKKAWGHKYWSDFTSEDHQIWNLTIESDRPGPYTLKWKATRNLVMTDNLAGVTIHLNVDTSYTFLSQRTFTIKGASSPVRELFPPVD